MQVIANNRPRPADPAWSVQDFIIAQGLDPRSVVVELNGRPLAREEYASTRLRDGDRIELVRAVAGG